MSHSEDPNVAIVTFRLFDPLNLRFNPDVLDKAEYKRFVSIKIKNRRPAVTCTGKNSTQTNVSLQVQVMHLSRHCNIIYPSDWHHQLPLNKFEPSVAFSSRYFKPNASVAIFP